jgi:hypothetical protein
LDGFTDRSHQISAPQYSESPTSFTAESPVAGPSHQQSAYPVTTETYIRPDVDMLQDIFLSNFRSGVRCSVFCNELRILKHSLKIHAIPAEHMSIKECQIALIHHLLMGDCVSRCTDKDIETPYTDRTACLCVANRFESAEDQGKAALNIILNADPNFLSIHRLILIAESFGIKSDFPKANMRRQISEVLKKRVVRGLISNRSSVSMESALVDMEGLPKASLISNAAHHGISLSDGVKRDDIQNLIMKHITQGNCLQKSDSASFDGCSRVRDAIYESEDMLPSTSDYSLNDLQVRILSSRPVKSLTLRPLRRILQLHGVSFPPDARLSRLRRELRKFITRLRKGKRSEERRNQENINYANFLRDKNKLIEEWPRPVSRHLKDKVLKLFRDQTSKDALSTFICAICAEECLNQHKCCVYSDEIDLNLLRRPDERLKDDLVTDPAWLDTECCPPDLPYTDGPLSGILLEPAGINCDEGRNSITLCRTCRTSIKKNKLPPLALANHNFLGRVPDELKYLTVVEEAMIARCRSKCWVVQLKEENRDLGIHDTQRGMKGHIIIYPQRPSDIAAILPPSMDEMTTPICVIFVGSSPPSDEWLRTKARPLIVRREKVRAALVWLKAHNTHYKDITIDHSGLDKLADEQILPVHVEHVRSSHGSDLATSRYDSSLPLETDVPMPSTVSDSVPFQNVVVTDIDGHAPANELRAAAVRHVKKNGGGYVEIPHDPEPVNEFCNPALFPMIYPTLFPYGIGGFESPERTSSLSMKRHVKHFFNLADKRFQEHYSFLFTAFNILQRRAVLLHSNLKVQRSNFDSVATAFATVSPGAVHVVSERIARGDFSTANNDEERKVLELMKQVKLVTSHVPGSSASRITMRNEIRGLMMDRGLPSFYVTINPADVFNPLVKFLAGSEIDVDRLLPEEVPKYQEQAYLVARNPAVAAKFFNIYMKAFISALLRYDPKQKDLEGGVLGVVKAYYGCVEAQGRGTLHCHMIIWLEGGLNPDEIKQRVLQQGDREFRDRLLAFLDDTISNSIPTDPDPDLTVPSSIHHPCSVRGVNPDLIGDDLEKARQKDKHNLVKQCQSHSHTDTCYKYWKGPPQPRECRFDLDEKNFCPESSFDSETGELCLRCLDGLVNNFNETILEAIRCNMDITFIGSGASAKAILYYITDYITKSQLKSHVAFAALELAVNKLGEYDPQADELMLRSKRLLQKCAYAMISHQELSAQQVCSYLMDFEDHFTSHEYRNLYWMNFEKFIDNEDPSPECYGKKQSPPEGSDDQENQPDILLDSLDLNVNHETQNSEHISEPEERENHNESIDEVVVSVDRQTGKLVARANQVADYQLRGEYLYDICVWDFVARVEKIKRKNCRKSPPKDKDTSDEDNVEDADFASEIKESDSEDDGEMIPKNQPLATGMLNARTRSRPTACFQSDHLEATSHILKVIHPDCRRIPVPIGPSIPRRDKENIRDRYCRLMLILFKPWRHANDLRDNGQTWQDAFNEFLRVCPTRLKGVMDNMQILHECRDSRDDHFSGRRNKGRNRSNRVPTELVGDRIVADDVFGESDEDESFILSHFESIENARSEWKSRSRTQTLECLRHVEESGRYRTRHPRVSTVDLAHSSIQLIESDKTSDLEEIWRKTYQDRRENWKKRSSCTANEKKIFIGENTKNADPQSNTSTIRDGSAFRKPNNEPEIRLPAFRQQIPASNADQDVNITAMIKEYNLNTEQARAFKIVSKHSLQKRPEPLRMFLRGPGGTGKSRVINALKDFFERRNQSRRFRLASYTGVAAKNISGMTLHTALGINQRSKSTRTKTVHDLVAMWEGVDFLFIDEVSMIGCNLLLQISEALTSAKGDTSAFGGINIIFAGDFAQLGPVGQTRLYAHVNTAESSTTKGQNTIFGKLLWLSVRTVVLLTEVMRQSGLKNEPFVRLLSRLREGVCTEEDYKLLSSRVVNKVKPDWSDPSWAGVPVIISDNEVKDALNEKAAVAFAKQTGQELHWYYAVDKHNSKILEDNELRTKLEKFHSGLTNQRLGKLPLVIGMPVIISSNFDVEAGVVNGCHGVLKQIRYYVDKEGRRHAISCVIEAPHTTGEKMPQLPEHHVVALEDTTDMKFVHPHSHKMCTIKCTQVPIVPAFAMTAHKAQGQTLTNALIDLESCPKYIPI